MSLNADPLTEDNNNPCVAQGLKCNEYTNNVTGIKVKYVFLQAVIHLTVLAELL